MDSLLSPVIPFTVSQISNLLRKTVEDTFGHIAVKGEISGCKVHTSGHIYFTLKDQDSLLDGVCWRGSVARLGVKPQDGIEVICYGKLTTYGARSKYQMIVESMELAGAGNLAKIFQERKDKLTAEGLFNQDQKKPLPYMPSVIGVITSETGAVIRDILHRLRDRFPVHVIVWPVAVQGNTAAQEITNAIDKFNALPQHFPRPDLLIVARGGGSLEDLWAFNEEMVVRAAARSQIPLISAVGHETDTTLIDYAADQRAPTPTAAAEIAVPVRSELQGALLGIRQKIYLAVHRHLREGYLKLETMRRGLISPDRFIQDKMQWLDEWQDRAQGAVRKLYHFHHQRLQFLSIRLHGPLLKNRIQRSQENLDQLSVRQRQAFQKIWIEKYQEVEKLRGLLEAYSYHRILNKGFAMVTGPSHKVVTKAKDLHAGDTITLTFGDGDASATIN